MTGAAVVGLVVNPVAGLGGAAGLKGSDGVEVQRAALARGATPRAGERAARAVRTLMARCPGTRVVTAPGPMGEDSARASGVPCGLVRTLSVDRSAGASSGWSAAGTSAEDTRRAVAALAGVDLLLFAGGDGTARDVLDAVRALGGQAPPVLGVPAGVKVYSGCFAVSPAAAGFVAAEFDPARTAEAEVVDLDEDAYRRGLVSPRLYGSLRVPAVRAALSGRKAGSSGVAPATAEGVAREVVARMWPGVRYVLGPGATTRAVGRALGLATTLLGVDVVERAPEGGRGGRLVAADVAETELFGLVSGKESVLVLSVIGGQGFVLGRGNQQVSPRVLDAVLNGGQKDGSGSSERLLVLATQQKLAALKGRPLLADSGDEDLDKKLGGHVQVITGYRESTIYRICAASEEFDG
ncbi:putative polyphosphate/ATP-dependent NAD kinase [Nonomuraea polychroma]|uniref:Putative polyphosphate/ATP-dependent NAD kinase n=1 Tax=Nonomuraea polychroma TaxID=46176 RepID=A0A438M2I1_9ACTN|nr:ATP-NAD kinase family protein [Nonomuraea polychroma]RVX39962.1 putative polyphosphate/ATP-dependent NAD kinase [Nonomuraea polychroma]